MIFPSGNSNHLSCRTYCSCFDVSGSLSYKMFLPANSDASMLCFEMISKHANHRRCLHPFVFFHIWLSASQRTDRQAAYSCGQTLPISRQHFKPTQRGEREREENQPTKYSPASRPSERPNLNESCPHAHTLVEEYRHSPKHALI